MMTNTTAANELKNIADKLARRSNDPEAMNQFNRLLGNMSNAQRRDLVVVLQQMIAESRQR